MAMKDDTGSVTHHVLRQSLVLYCDPK